MPDPGVDLSRTRAEIAQALVDASNGDEAALKKHYHRLCLQLHPDTSGAEGEEFRRLHEAYLAACEVLRLKALADGFRPLEFEGAQESPAQAHAHFDPVPNPPPPRTNTGSYYGVEYWKYRTAAQRLNFRISQLDALRKCLPDDFALASDYRRDEEAKKNDKAWRLVFRRAAQVVPLAAQDRSLVDALAAVEECLESRSVFGEDAGLLELSSRFLDLLEASLRLLGLSPVRQLGANPDRANLHTEIEAFAKLSPDSASGFLFEEHYFRSLRRGLYKLLLAISQLSRP